MTEADYDLIAEPGDCLSEVPADQLEREATDLKATHDGRLPEGEPVPDDVELV
jgi:hypothetical protein